MKHIARHFCTLILFLLTWTSNQAQEFKIISVNTSQYPEITATFLATDSKGQKVLNAAPTDFKITENAANANIIEVTNPNAITLPVSVVLVFDNSYSMTGTRLQMALRAARLFIDQMPLESSEIAIASFSENTYVNCDFTQDRTRLYNALDNIKTLGGTNYTAAFLDETSGALSLARNGRYKKYVIFLTDGLSYTDPAAVVRVAKDLNTTIFCVTMELVTPQILKDISSQTGGTYFQTNADSENLNGIYNAIFQLLEVRKYGSVTWRAPLDCKADKEVKITFRNLSAGHTYSLPKNLSGSLEVDPNQLMFGIAKTGVKKMLSFDIEARNIPVSITRLSLPANSPFHLEDTIQFPFTLAPKEVKNVTLSFRPTSSRQVQNKIIISSRECTDKQIALTGGSDQELRITCPKGKETFVTGMDTSIRWEGVRKDQDIGMWYRIEPRKDWTRIDEGKDLRYAWKVPNDTGKRVQVRIQTLANPNARLYLTSTIPNQRNGIQNVCFSADGTKILISDQTGIINIWNVRNGTEVNGLPPDTPKGFAIFGKSDDVILFFNKNRLLTWSQETNRIINSQFLPNKTILTPFLLPSGLQMLISTNTAIISDTVRLRMPEINLSKWILEKEGVRAAGLSADGTKAVTLTPDNTIKIWNTNSRNFIQSRIKAINPQTITIAPDSRTAIINALGIMHIMDMRTGAELFHFQRYIPPSYSKTGDMLILKENADVYFNDSYTGKILFSIYKPGYYETLKQGGKLLFYRNDTLQLLDVRQHNFIFKKFQPNVLDIVISPEEDKVMIVSGNNTIDFLSMVNGQRINQITGMDKGVQTAFFNPNKKGIMVMMKNKSLQYWSTEGNDDEKEAFSGYFTILSPKPSVKKQVDFGSRLIGTETELSINDFVTNSNPFPVKILKMELVSGDTVQFGLVSNGGPFILKPGEEKAAEFRFMCSDLPHTEALMRTYTASDTFETRISGKGMARTYNIVEQPVRFGKVKVGLKKDSLATIIRNNGKEVLHLRSLANNGPDRKQFSCTSEKTYTLQPGDSLRLAVTFAPTLRGKTSGSISFVVDETLETGLIRLEGEGMAPRSFVVAGRTLNSTDSLPIQADVRLFDLESHTILRKVPSGKNGQFTFPVNADRNYGMIAERKGYLSESENIDLRQVLETDTIHKDIFLTPIQAGAMIRMNCIFFEFAKANLLDVSKNELDRIAEFLSEQRTIRIEIHGHTDSIGSNASNLTLSAQRSNAVKRYLVKKGIDPSRMSTRFFGESQPVSTNSTEEGRQMNRRVEVKIVSM